MSLDDFTLHMETVSYCIMTRKKIEAGIREPIDFDLEGYRLISYYFSRFWGKQVHLLELNGQEVQLVYFSLDDGPDDDYGTDENRPGRAVLY